MDDPRQLSKLDLEEKKERMDEYEQRCCRFAVSSSPVTAAWLHKVVEGAYGGGCDRALLICHGGELC